MIAVDGAPESCVLCQQPLGPAAADRMARFQAYMDDTLGATATDAEKAVSDAQSGHPESVSYTHLDVYKRQLDICAGVNVRREAPCRLSERTSERKSCRWIDIGQKSREWPE